MIKYIRLLAILLTAFLSASTASAFTLEEFTFDDPARAAEFRDLIGEIRCLVCQNESLAGSQADLAQDLREEVYRMMQEGQSREQVVDFLVARYGDFVLYEPPIKPSTYLLWFGPMLLVGVGGIVLFRTLLRKRRTKDEDLSAEDRERLQEILTTDADSPQAGAARGERSDEPPPESAGRKDRS